jgi:hypothetical protein
MVRVAYIGNFNPPHSTENHVAQAFRDNGHQVTPLQEELCDWATLAQRAHDLYDLVLWTRTPDLDRCDPHALANIRPPVVGYHLDRWWGLRRETEITTSHFFAVDLLATADGDHDDQWASVGVEHLWLPPAIAVAEVRTGTHRDRFACDVAFVGNWRGDYHPEAKHRAALIKHLKRNWGGRVRFFPEVGQERIVGVELADLYASVKVVVGDSCSVGDRYTKGRRLTRYHSDRIPETLGRGGVLVHPHTEGAPYGPVVHYVGWDEGDWRGLDKALVSLLADDERRARLAYKGQAWVRKHHTYSNRVNELLVELRIRGILK